MNIPAKPSSHEDFGQARHCPDFVANYPALFADNRKVAPGFRDEAAYDSHCSRQALWWMTELSLPMQPSDSSGVTVEVDDARCIHGGFGIAGVQRRSHPAEKEVQKQRR